MKHHNKRSFLLGVLTALLVACMIPGALALSSKRIDVSTGIRIYVNDSQITPTDSAGNPIEAFIYNGTTYLPVRAVSDALGTPVQWDGSTQSVYIGRHASSTPAAYLCQLDYFNSSGRWAFGKITKDNLGNEHSYSIDRTTADVPGPSKLTYKLNGQYSRLTGVYYREYSSRSSQSNVTNTLVITGDGRELWHGTVGAGIDPINIDIDITGVLELTINYETYTWCALTALGDVALWT